MGQISGDEIRAAEFPVRAHGYIRHQVRLARIADLHEKGFARARYAPPVTRQPRQLAGGRSSWHGRAYDADAVDRFFAALAGDAPPALRTLPEFPVSRSGSGQPSRPGRRTVAWQQYAGDCA